MRSFKYFNKEKTYLSMSQTPKHTKANESGDKEQEKTRQAQTTPGGFCSSNKPVLSAFLFLLLYAAEALQEAAQKPQQHYNQLFLPLKEKAQGEGNCRL